MKTSAIIRIICWVLIACALVGVLLWGLGRGGSGLSFSFFPASWIKRGLNNLQGFGEQPGDLGEYSTDNSYAVEIGTIDTLSVYWVDGSVRITPYDGDTIAFNESAVGGIPEKYALRYAVSGSTLSIHYIQSGINWNNNWWGGGKSLEVLVPKTLAQNFSLIDVDAVSAGVYVGDLSCGKLKLATVSGAIDLANIEANSFDADTTSGRIEASGSTISGVSANTVSGAVRLDGSFDKVSVNTMSGATKINSSVCPSKVDVDTVSGSSTLSIPDNDGFTVRHDSVSGSFSCDFPTTSSSNKATYANGTAAFSFNSVSGSIKIEKNG